LIVVVAIVGSLLLLRFDACPQPINILEYLRTYGLTSEAILIDGFFTRPSLGFPPSATAVTPDTAAIDAGENFCLGRFRVAFVQTGHVPLPFGAGNPGNITTPTIPATVGDHREGGTFAVFVQYRGRGRFMLVQGSAGFSPGAL
jgi:hypothetical protein